MRNLTVEEVTVVAGGNDSGGQTNPVVEACTAQNLPDSTEMTVTHIGSGGLSLGGNGTNTTTTITVTTTCGEAKEALKEAQSQSSDK